MSTLAKDADGDRVYDPRLKRWIQYNSRSDALLANLLLQHHFRLDQLDLVLNMVREPGFDASTITTSTPADVMRTISLDGRRIALERSRPEQIWEVKRPGMPSVVFDLVLDTIKQDLSFFEEDVRYYAPLVTTGSDRERVAARSPSHSTRQDLLNMTFVHRAWTPDVRKVLQQRIVISGPNQLVSFMRSVYCGPDVRELILHITGEFEDDLNFPSCASLFAGIFSHCPNIQSLSLKFSGSNKKAVSFESTSAFRILVCRMAIIVNHALGNMATHLSQLERLWLIAESFSVPGPCWSELCNALARLGSLQSLCIAGPWGTQFSRINPDENLNYISPSSSLKTIEFRSSGAWHIPSEILTWLFLPSLTGTESAQASTPRTIENTVIPLGDAAASLLDGETPEAQQAIAKMWASLRSLDCTSGSLHRVTQAIALCSGLRKLTISVQLFWKLAEKHLPATLEHLVLTCLDVDFIRVHDKAAVELLERAVKTVRNGPAPMLRNLRRVDFLIHEHLLENKRFVSKANQDGIVIFYMDSLECMSKTSNACHALGIEFKVDTFLDFLEIPKTAM